MQRGCDLWRNCRKHRTLSRSKIAARKVALESATKIACVNGPLAWRFHYMMSPVRHTTDTQPLCRQATCHQALTDSFSVVPGRDLMRMHCTKGRPDVLSSNPRNPHHDIISTRKLTRLRLLRSLCVCPPDVRVRVLRVHHPPPLPCTVNSSS